MPAGVASRNDIGRAAVLARVAKAEGGSWHEVSTGWVDGGSVNGSELIGGDVISGGNTVTNITIFNDV